MRKDAAAPRRKISARIFTSEAKNSTIDRVINTFKELLKNGQLKPGDRMPNETELAKSFGASRGSIREAIKVLASFGVLQVKWGDGTYVANTISENMVDRQLFHLLIRNNDNDHLLELREVMECGVAQLAVVHANEDDLEDIEKVHNEMKDMILAGERDPEILAQADANFHFSLSKATHNPPLEKIYKFAMELYYPSIVQTHGNRKSEEMLQSPIVHQGILDAIRKRSKSAALNAVKKSLKTWYAHL